MKALIVSRSTLGHRVGGLERYVDWMLRRAGSWGLEVSLLTAPGASAGYANELSALGVELFELDGTISDRYDERWYRALETFRRPSDLDFVIFHGLAGASTRREVNGPRLISLTHGSLPISLRNSNLDSVTPRASVGRVANFFRFRELGMLRDHELVCLSEYDARLTAAVSLRRADTITVIPPAVEPMREPSVERRKQILFAGRLERSKGVFSLLRAWDEVSPEGYELVLAGSGAAEAQVNRSSSVGVRLVGSLAAADLAVEQASSMWAVSAGKYVESFGLAVAESLAVGTPTIYPRRGALPETTSGAGLPYRGADGLVRSLRTAISMPQEVWDGFSARARARASDFSPARVDEQWISLLRGDSRGAA